VKQWNSEIVKLSGLLTAKPAYAAKKFRCKCLKLKKSKIGKIKYISFFSLNVIGIKIIFSSLHGCKPQNYVNFRVFSQFLKIKSQLSSHKRFENFYNLPCMSL
jgi:hypothetical protein